MPIVPAGSTNLSAIGVPNVYTQLIPPSPILNAAETDVIMVVGTGSAGPVNKPVVIGGISEQVSTFGVPAPIKYDMGTQVYNATLQGANNFICIRVTDGSDTSATANILGGSSVVGSILTSIYTGALYNTLTATISNGSGSTTANPTFRLTIFLAGGVPEVFDNIGGVGDVFWTNLINAVNLGQSNARPPSQLVTASILTSISSVTITSPGSYASFPTFGVSGPGSGAILVGTMEAVSASPIAPGTGYVPGDTITFSGGTGTQAVATVTNTQIISIASNAAGSGYNGNDSITLAGGTFVSAAVMKVLTTKLVTAAVNISSPGSGYAVSDTITTSGGTFTSAAVLTVATASLVSLARNAAGSGYAIGDTITLAGGTPSSAAIVQVRTVSGGAIATFAITFAGVYTATATSFTQGSTSGSGTGATFNTALFGVNTVTISTPGSYTVNATTLNQASTSGSGTGASFNTALFGVLTSSILNSGSYTANSSTFTQGSTSGTGTGATFNTSVFGVLNESITTPGAYSALPPNPVTQSATSGSGTGCTNTVLWGVLSIAVTAGGTGYTSASALSITGGGEVDGAVGILNIGSAGTIINPASYAFSGGTNGNNDVNDATLIGSDILPRTGMYAGRNTSSSICILADQTTSSFWTNQVNFGLYEGKYMIGAMPPGYQDNLSGAITLLQNTGVLSYAFKLMLGDYILINDPFNNIQRYVTPQGFVAGILANLSPEQSSLNKAMNGIVATAKTAESGVYSNADLLLLMTGGIDVITRPIPLGNAFGCRLGVNTSGVFSIGDNFTRMNNFLAATFTEGLGPFVGQPQTPTVRAMAKSTLDTFLGNLFILNIIGDVNFPGNQSKAYKVILDDTNNPSSRVAQGFMQADVRVVLYSIILDFIVNLEAGQGVTIQTLPPQNNVQF